MRRGPEVVNRAGSLGSKAATSAAAIGVELAKAPTAQRIVETGRMATTLYHGAWVRALIIARKKLVGQRVTLENQIRGLVHARRELEVRQRRAGEAVFPEQRQGLLQHDALAKREPV